VKKDLKKLPDGELVRAGYVLVIYVCKFCVKSLGLWSVISDLLDQGGRMGWTVSKKLGLEFSEIGLV
jgi:hypothetical protein